MTFGACSAIAAETAPVDGVIDGASRPVRRGIPRCAADGPEQREEGPFRLSLSMSLDHRRKVGVAASVQLHRHRRLDRRAGSPRAAVSQTPAMVLICRLSNRRADLSDALLVCDGAACRLDLLGEDARDRRRPLHQGTSRPPNATNGLVSNLL